MESLTIPSDHRVIKVDSVGINRADILQKEGKYPADKNGSSILGLECSGHLYDLENDRVTDQKVCALLNGGGYSEYCTVHKDHLINIGE